MSDMITAKKVLVVDDEPLNCEVLMEFLSSKGYQVEMALSGDEALEVSNKVRPHLVLLDVNMPGKSGLETLRDLKTLAPDVFVILLTGFYDEALARQAEDEGVVGYITKPVHFDHLLELISKLDWSDAGG